MNKINKKQWNLKRRFEKTKTKTKIYYDKNYEKIGYENEWTQNKIVDL